MEPDLITVVTITIIITTVYSLCTVFQELGRRLSSLNPTELSNVLVIILIFSDEETSLIC